MKQLLILSFAVLVCRANSCQKDKDRREEVEFEFVIPMSMAPGNDTVAVGQTLTLSADFSDSLYDALSQKKYHLPNFNFKTVAVIKRLSNNNVQYPEQGGGSFEFTNVLGALSNIGSSFADVNYVYQNRMYMLNVNIKCNQPGVYGISFFNSTGTRSFTDLPQWLAPNEPGLLRFPIIRQTRYVFNDGNTHFNIYKQHCKPADPNEATNWVESKSTYTFVVK
jgi:hypothetical protein